MSPNIAQIVLAVLAGAVRFILYKLRILWNTDAKTKATTAPVRPNCTPAVDAPIRPTADVTAIFFAAEDFHKPQADVEDATPVSVPPTAYFPAAAAPVAPPLRTPMPLKEAPPNAKTATKMRAQARRRSADGSGGAGGGVALAIFQMMADVKVIKRNALAARKQNREALAAQWSLLFHAIPASGVLGG